jgi:hypothetical protein
VVLRRPIEFTKEARRVRPFKREPSFARHLGVHHVIANAVAVRRHVN